jgi:hypothetical protein
MLWVVTNGREGRNLLWVIVRKTGIYVASGGPGSLHSSYHSDGTFHWKLKGRKLTSETKPPLLGISEPLLIQNGTRVITDEALEHFELARFRDKPVDRVVYLDNRMLPDAIAYHVWVVPPFRHSAVPLITEWPAQIHVVTHTTPWIEVVIYEQGNRKGRAKAVSITNDTPLTSLG